MKHNKRNRFKVLFLALLLGTSFLGGAGEAEGKSVAQTQDFIEMCTIVDGCSSPAGLYAYDVTITYHLNAFHAGTNTFIPENSVLPVGTQIDYRIDLRNEYIFWHLTGYSVDSPYGHWVTDISSYTPDLMNGFAVQYPVVTYDHSGSPAGLSCNADGSTCTVTSAGDIYTRVTYAATDGEFEDHASLSSSSIPVSFSSETIDYTLTAVAGNTLPSAPSLTGPTSGTVNVSYPYTAQASDGDGDTLRYGMDWDNNGSVDQWMPGAGFVASNTPETFNHLWPTAGTYTIQALTQDNQGGTSGWSTPLTITIQNTVNGICGAAHNFSTTNPPIIGLCLQGTPTAVTPGVAPGPYSWTCTGSGGGIDQACSAPYLTPAPVVDLKVNGSDGPLTVNRNSNLNITWGNIPNATSCTGTGLGGAWDGMKALTGGNDNMPATTATNLTLSCTGPGGITIDTVSVTLQPTLKICQNSCSSSIEPPSSFSMNRYDTKDLVACHNDALSCTDATGDVTTLATWTEGGGSAVSLGGSSPKTLTADNVGTESIQASYNGQNVSRSISVICNDSGACQRDPQSQTLCASDTFTVVDNCGVTQNCNGSKSCDYNWKEVAPN